MEHARSLLALSRERYVSPSLMACAAAVVTGMDDAFAWLDRAFQEHDVLPDAQLLSGRAAPQTRSAVAGTHAPYRPRAGTARRTVTALNGEGGMGTVYRATETNLKRTVAKAP